MNYYHIHISYSAPEEALIEMFAPSEEAARESLIEQLGHYPDFEINDIAQVAVTPFTADDLNPNKTVN